MTQPIDNEELTSGRRSRSPVRKVAVAARIVEVAGSSSTLVGASKESSEVSPPEVKEVAGSSPARKVAASEVEDLAVPVFLARNCC